MLISFNLDVHIALKISRLYVTLLIFQIDMLYIMLYIIYYVNYVLKACFKRVVIWRIDMRKLKINDEVYHHSRLYYTKKSPFLLIELKILQKQHLMIINAVQMLNMIFSLQLFATIIISLSLIIFEIYFPILH